MATFSSFLSLLLKLISFSSCLGATGHDQRGGGWWWVRSRDQSHFIGPCPGMRFSSCQLNVLGFILSGIHAGRWKKKTKTKQYSDSLRKRMVGESHISLDHYCGSFNKIKRQIFHWLSQWRMVHELVSLDTPIIKLMHNYRLLRLMFLKMKDYRLEKNKNKSEWNRIVISESWRLDKDIVFQKFCFIYFGAFCLFLLFIKINSKEACLKIQWMLKTSKEAPVHMHTPLSSISVAHSSPMSSSKNLSSLDLQFKKIMN